MRQIKSDESFQVASDEQQAGVAHGLITQEMTGIYKLHQREMTREQLEQIYPGNPENKHAQG